MKREQVNGNINVEQQQWKGRFAVAQSRSPGSSNFIYIYLLLVSATLIVVVPNVWRQSLWRVWSWGADDEAVALDDDAVVEMAARSRSAGYSNSMKKKRPQRQLQVAHYTLLYDESYKALKEAYEGKCESLEVVVMDLQRVLQAERARSVVLENEVRVLHISDNFLRDRLFFLEDSRRSTRLQQDSSRSAPAPPNYMYSASSRSTDRVEPFLNNDNKFNSKASPSTSSSSSNPPPRPSFAAAPPKFSSSAAAGRGRGGSFGLEGLQLDVDSAAEVDMVVRDLLRMVMLERERTSELQTEIRSLQRSESLMHARIQILEDHVAAAATAKTTPPAPN